MAYYAPEKLSDKEVNALNLAFLRALISGGVAFNFADDYYFAVKPLTGVKLLRAV